MPVVSPVTPGELEAYFRVRWELLRKPWGQPRGSERDASDSDATHCMIRDATGAIVAIGRLHMSTADTARIRYMAVIPACRRRGLGTALLAGLEERGRARGASRFLLDARNEAVPFYASQSYRPLGPGPVLFDAIPHTRMEKVFRAVNPGEPSRHPR